MLPWLGPIFAVALALIGLPGEQFLMPASVTGPVRLSEAILDDDKDQDSFVTAVVSVPDASGSTPPLPPPPPEHLLVRSNPISASGNADRVPAVYQQARPDRGLRRPDGQGAQTTCASVSLTPLRC